MTKPLNPAFFFSGIVIDGEKVGRKIGFPTANLDFIPEKLDTGVYLGTINVNSKRYYCLAYFGPRFIFGEEKNNFEVYIYDFDEQIYGLKLDGELLQKIREPKKIATLHELKDQLQLDKELGIKLIQQDL